jgi:hypothetical protein
MTMFEYINILNYSIWAAVSYNEPHNISNY